MSAFGSETPERHKNSDLNTILTKETLAAKHQKERSPSNIAILSSPLAKDDDKDSQRSKNLEMPTLQFQSYARTTKPMSRETRVGNDPAKVSSLRSHVHESNPKVSPVPVSAISIH